MQDPDHRGNAEGEGKDQRHGDPGGQTGEKAVKVVPASVFLPDHRHHDVVQGGIDRHRDQGQQGIQDPQALLAHEEAEGDEGQDRADPVQEEARPGEDQQKALHRSQDAQGDEKGEGYRRDPGVYQDYDPTGHMVVVLPKPVQGIGDDHGHGRRGQDIGVHREHAEGAQTHVIEVLVMQGREVHGDADAYAYHHAQRAEQGKEALSAGVLHDFIHLCSLLSHTAHPVCLFSITQGAGKDNGNTIRGEI